MRKIPLKIISTSFSSRWQTSQSALFPCNLPMFSYVWILSKKSYACDKPGLANAWPPRSQKSCLLMPKSWDWQHVLQKYAAITQGGGRRIDAAGIDWCIIFPLRIWLVLFCNILKSMTSRALSTETLANLAPGEKGFFSDMHLIFSDFFLHYIR